ncbi:hypothetical protein O9929_23440 [Vibrio lentus]|nr:hypothetical protein [Vibrio lentus]
MYWHLWRVRSQHDWYGNPSDDRSANRSSSRCSVGCNCGVIIAKGKVQAFIATLVTMTSITRRNHGLHRWSPSYLLALLTQQTRSLGSVQATQWGIPVLAWIMVVVFAAVWYLLNHTRFGRYVYALGGNESATRLSGIDVDKVKIGVYANLWAVSSGG